MPAARGHRGRDHVELVEELQALLEDQSTLIGVAQQLGRVLVGIHRAAVERNTKGVEEVNAWHLFAERPDTPLCL